MRRLAPLFALASLVLLVLGCGRTPAAKPAEGSPVTTYQQLIAKIDRGEYTTFVSHRFWAGDVVRVREVTELFKYKEAYPWLIRAVEGLDEKVAETAREGFNSSGTPGSFTTESLRRYYAVPDNQLVWTGVLWEPLSGAEPEVFARLLEAREHFTIGGKPIHPALLYEFNQGFEDRGPVVTAVEPTSGQTSDRYFYAPVRQRAGWTECSVKSLPPHCAEKDPPRNEPMFGYQRLGSLAEGTQVLRVYYQSGGSGIFLDLFFIRFETEKAYDSAGKPFTRIVMRCVCQYPLGDRDDAEVKVLPDRVIVGKSKYRDKEVELKLD